MKTRIAGFLLFTGSILIACSYTLPKLDDSTRCGDNIVDDNELCDDGNTVDGDGCDSNCTPTGCGNGIVSGSEQCDDGNMVDTDDCTAECVVGVCGDGIQKSTEECDDDNLQPGDECDPNCTKPRCGNGYVAVDEICDDGNTVNGDDCNATCSLRGISTNFAGQPGVAGNVDGQGTQAQIRGNHYMSLLGDTIYIAHGQTVRMIDIPTAQVTTIAGADGAADYLDATTGTDARFRDLRGITTDGKTIWVADVGNHVIRAIDAGGTHSVTTAAGAPDATTSAVPIADGDVTQARFDSPRGLTYLNGVVYLVETNAVVLRAYNVAAKAVYTLAGLANTPGSTDGYASAARFGGPRHTAQNGTNLLYIADTGGFTIRTYDTTTTEVKTIAGVGASCGYANGPALSAKFNAPRGMAFEGDNLYIVDDDAHNIRQMQMGPMLISTFTGTPASCFTDCSCNPNPGGGYVEGSPNMALWNYPYDVVYHAPTHSLFVSDGANDVVRRIQ